MECHSVVAARLEAIETQLQSLLQGTVPPPGLQPTDDSDSRPNGPAVQFELATPVQETETQPTATENAMQQAANDAWAQSLAVGGSPFRQSQESSNRMGAGPAPTGAPQVHGPPRAQERPVPEGAAFSTADSLHAQEQSWSQYRSGPARPLAAQPHSWNTGAAQPGMPANPPTVQLNLPQHLQSPLTNSYNSPVGRTHHAQPQFGQQQQQTVGAPPENRGGYSKDYGYGKPGGYGTQE